MHWRSFGTALALLQGPRWTHVVLQAQKYSSSGQFEYSTAEAAALIRLARPCGALPVLFPEGPHLGVSETARIVDLHVSMAQAEPACVAPVGQAFDLAAQHHPALGLPALDVPGVDVATQALLRAVSADTVRRILVAGFRAAAAAAPLRSPAHARRRRAAPRSGAT